jgi:hypothetical protein
VLRKVGRGAHHRRLQIFRFQVLKNLVEIVVVEAREEARIEFDSIDIERCGQVDPVEERHAPRDAEFIHVAFWEDREFRHSGNLSWYCRRY